MGTNITSLLESEEISIDDLNGKILAIDAYNILYQFLSSLRMPDGTPLKDSKGNITSHLNGLFLRTFKLMKKNIKLIFVFDGQHPELKAKEIQKRKERKEEAAAKLKDAISQQDQELMRKYSMQTVSLTQDMVKEAKELLTYMGIPYIDAPSEGEAQAAYMVKKGDADYVVSQDADALLFGAPNVIRNLTISQKRKKLSTLAYDPIKPQKFNLSYNLNKLGLDQQKLIILSILVGTDFNPGGIKGIGPVKALKAVKETNDYDKLFNELKWDDYFEYSWKEVYSIFDSMPLTDDYELKWDNVNKEKIIELLCDKHDFNKERITKELDSFKLPDTSQKGLFDFT
ncbi:MAG: flap endonuclease-1 [Candidatus Woesearchaeota archaeon]